MSQSTSAIRGQRAPAQRREERRASVRHQSTAKGSCHTLNASRETSWDAIVRDISAEGIGLVLGRRFEPGVLLSIEVPDNTDGQPRLLLARVVHATPFEGGWLIGCALLNPLTDDEVQALR